MTRKIPAGIQRHLKPAMANYASQIVSLMEATVAERSGDLKNSLGWVFGAAPPGSRSVATLSPRTGGGDLFITIFAGDEATDRDYDGKILNNALFQEFGTKHMPANPYFYISWKKKKRSLRSGMAKAMKKGIRAGAR